MRVESLWKVVIMLPDDAFRMFGQAVTDPAPSLRWVSMTETSFVKVVCPPFPSKVWTSTRYCPLETTAPLSAVPSQTKVVPLLKVKVNWVGTFPGWLGPGWIRAVENWTLLVAWAPGSLE